MAIIRAVGLLALGVGLLACLADATPVAVGCVIIASLAAGAIFWGWRA